MAFPAPEDAPAAIKMIGLAELWERLTTTNFDNGTTSGLYST
jgi:hypothetical protein